MQINKKINKQQIFSLTRYLLLCYLLFVKYLWQMLLKLNNYRPLRIFNYWIDTKPLIFYVLLYVCGKKLIISIFISFVWKYTNWNRYFLWMYVWLHVQKYTSCCYFFFAQTGSIPWKVVIIKQTKVK